MIIDNTDAILNFIEKFPLQVWILLGVGLLFFILNLLFPKKEKTQEQQEQDMIERSRKHNTNYSVRTYSTIQEGRGDHVAPGDGTTIHTTGTSGYKKIDKINHTEETLKRLPKYENLLNEHRLTNLNTLAKNIGITNNEAAKDIKYFKKKKHLFKNVIIDEITCKISYTDGFDDENNYDPANENTDITQEDEYEDFDNDGNLKCRCKKCGTINIIGVDDTQFTCFTCFTKNDI